EPANVLSTLTFTTGLQSRGRSWSVSRTLVGNDDDIGLESGGPDLPEQFHHIGVADVLVAAQVNHAFRLRPRFPYRLDFGQQVGRGDLRIAKIQLDIRIAAAVGSLDRQRQRRRV